MADTRFPLLRLPFLALCIILDFYNLHDIIQLSLCSKRGLRVAKKCWKKKGLVKTYLCAERIPSITLYYNEGLSYEFFISRTQDLGAERPHNIRVGDAVVPSIHRETETVTYWEDKIFGIGQIVDYIKYMFDEPIHSIDWEADAHPIEFINTIDSIMSRQESVEDCTLRGENSIDDCLAHLLDNCKIIGKLRIFGELGPQFRHDWNIHLNGLHILNGSCFTLQNLTSIDCQALELHNSSLTSEDANQFLKHWQNGGSSRIRCASIMINSMNHDIVTSGIETVPLTQGEDRNYPCMHDIKRNDGKTGTIHLDRDTFGFGVDPIEGLNLRRDL